MPARWHDILSSGQDHLPAESSLPMLPLGARPAVRGHSHMLANRFLFTALNGDEAEVDASTAGAAAAKAEDDSAFLLHKASHTADLAEEASRVTWIALAIAGGMAAISTVTVVLGVMDLRRAKQGVDEAEAELEATGWPSVLRSQDCRGGEQAANTSGPPAASPWQAMERSLNPQPPPPQHRG